MAQALHLLVSEHLRDRLQQGLEVDREARHGGIQLLDILHQQQLVLDEHGCKGVPLCLVVDAAFARGNTIACVTACVKVQEGWQHTNVLLGALGATTALFVEYWNLRFTPPTT